MRTLVVLGIVAMLAPPPATLKLSKSFCLPPCDVRADVWFNLKPEMDVRRATLELDGEAYYRSSYIDLNEYAAKHYEIWFKTIPPGSYEAILTLFDTTKGVYATRATLVVKGEDGHE